jgi:hypothetical protein
MNNHYRGTSRLGRMSVDDLLEPISPSLETDLLRDLQTAENKRLMALQADNGDMWARAWESVKDIEEQLTLLDACALGWIVPLLSDEELNGVTS